MMELRKDSMSDSSCRSASCHGSNGVAAGAAVAPVGTPIDGGTASEDVSGGGACGSWEFSAAGVPTGAAEAACGDVALKNDCGTGLLAPAAAPGRNPLLAVDGIVEKTTRWMGSDDNAEPDAGNNGGAEGDGDDDDQLSVPGAVCTPCARRAQINNEK
jgi:hypothetical protein